MSKHIDKILKNKADPVEQPDNKEEPKTVEKEDLQNELLAKVESLQDKLLRNIAEMENVRKRASKEIEEMKKYSVSSLVKDLIDVSENIHRALESIDQEKLSSDPAFKSIYDGIDMTKSSMMSILEKYGVKRIFPANEPFDHNHHQAIGQSEDSGLESGYVAQVVQAGYILRDRLLRPALVIVAK
jgi:molecular chaperone GrpE